MILQALVGYYEALESQRKIPGPGWVNAKISYGLNLDAEGMLTGILPLKEDVVRGKKTVSAPKNLTMPEGVKRSSGIAAQFLWDNSRYILGLDKNNNSERANKCFLATKEKCNDVLKDAHNVAATAIKNFFASWQPSSASSNTVLRPFLTDILEAANLTFFVNGDPAYDDKVIKEAWDNYKNTNSSEVVGYCLVTGKKAPIARLHPSIKGVKGAQSSGAALVSFNAHAYESYGQEQGLNAPVSEYAAFAYTSALNNLLADSKHHQQIGDTTVVFWAEDAEEASSEVFGSLLWDTESNILKNTTLTDFFKKISDGKPFDINSASINPSNKFYILGLSPNAARISVRFFLVNTFGKFMKNLQKYYEELDIIKPAYDNKDRLPLWIILQETANKNSKDKSATPILIGSMLRSILTGEKYPEALLQNIILRAKADQDNPDKKISKINRIKAAVIKACLLRNYENEEVATVPLNEESKNVPYILGRLFAVLENLQENANPGLNSTIKDRYFNSACSTPSIIFPVLTKLSEHHLKKIRSDKRRVIYFEKYIRQLLNKIEMKDRAFPLRLSLEEQGAFILGYYHQVEKFYQPKEKEV